MANIMGVQDGAEGHEAAPSLTCKVELRLLDAVRKEHPCGLLRSLMSREERALARLLVKRGVLRKGPADLKRSQVAYFLTGED